MTLMSQIPATPPTKPPAEGAVETPTPPAVAPVVPITPTIQLRGAGGRFTAATPTPVPAPTPVIETVPTPVIETVPTPVIETVPIPVPAPLPEPVPVPIPIPPVDPAVLPTPTGKDLYLARYAEKLKVELGDKYSAHYDKMKVENRIDAMEATIDGMKPKTPKIPEIPPIVKTEGNVPLNVPAIPEKVLTTMEIQEKIGYANLIKNAGSQMGIAKGFYDKLVKKYKE